MLLARLLLINLLTEHSGGGWSVYFGQSEQPNTQFTRHAVVVIIRVKNPTKAPVIIAPMMLVAAKVKASKIADKTIVPSIAIRTTGNIIHTHLRKFSQRSVPAVSNNTAR